MKLVLQIGRSSKQPVESLREASQRWAVHRDACGIFASEMPRVVVINAETRQLVARISYNGRVWTPGGYEIAI